MGKAVWGKFKVDLRGLGAGAASAMGAAASFVSGASGILSSVAGKLLLYPGVAGAVGSGKRREPRDFRGVACVKEGGEVSFCRGGEAAKSFVECQGVARRSAARNQTGGRPATY